MQRYQLISTLQNLKQMRMPRIKLKALLSIWERFVIIWAIFEEIWASFHRFGQPFQKYQTTLASTRKYFITSKDRVGFVESKNGRNNSLIFSVLVKNKPWTFVIVPLWKAVIVQVDLNDPFIIYYPFYAY